MKLSAKRLQYTHVIVIFPMFQETSTGVDFYLITMAHEQLYISSSWQKVQRRGHDFQLKDWRKEWIKLTNDWRRSRKPFPVASTGNALETSRWLYNQYLRSPDTKNYPMKMPLHCSMYFLEKCIICELVLTAAKYLYEHIYLFCPCFTSLASIPSYPLVCSFIKQPPRFQKLSNLVLALVYYRFQSLSTFRPKT